MRNTPHAGFTLIEVVIVAAVFALVFTAIWGTFTNTSREVRATAADVDLDVSLRRSIARIATELANSGRDLDGNDQVLSHPPAGLQEATLVSFRRRLAVTGDEAADWSEPITYALVPSEGEVPENGVDDDGDGIIDEQSIVRVEQDEPVMLVDGVLTFRVSRDAGANAVRLELELARPGFGAQPVRQQTISTLVAFRNR